MLGGGNWVTQNKVLPGAYINVVSAAKATATLGERGVVAIAIPIAQATAGQVISCSISEYSDNFDSKFGETVSENSKKVLSELFKHATQVYVYDTYTPDSGGVAPTTATILKALEQYDFNILACYTKESADIEAYITKVKSWRDEGKKCQAVVYNAEDADHEGVIVVSSTVADDSADEHALVAWVAGAEAGCAINATCTNMLYDGDYTIITNHTQSELEGCIEAGQIVFHRVYGDVRVLEDINSLTTTTADKGEDFKSNQTIRVADQIVNDMARLFNTKYLGKIPNDAAGRTSFWGDIVKHHRSLEELRAIENFDSSLVTVEPGNTKKSIIVTDTINVVNAMSQLYMTVIIQ